MAAGAAVSMNMVLNKNLRYKKQVGPTTNSNAPLLTKPLKPSFQKWKQIVRHRQFVAAKQIIICVVLSGVVIVAIGIAITVISFTSFTSYNPWRLIGPCVISCGLLVMLLCIELCMKRSKIGPIDTEDMNYLQGHTVQEHIHRYGFGNYKPEGNEENGSSNTDKLEAFQKSKNGKEEKLSKGLFTSERKYGEKMLERRLIAFRKEKATAVTPKRIEVKSGEKKAKSEEEETNKQHTLHVSPPGVPDVGLVSASPHPPEADESPSQENLELLLSPNSLD